MQLSALITAFGLLMAGCAGDSGGPFAFIAAPVTDPGSPPVQLHNLVLDEYTLGDGKISPEEWYSIDAATDCDYNVTWDGNVDVSIYENDKATPIIPVATAHQTAKIHTDECKRFYVRVEAADPAGEYKLKYSIDPARTPQTWTLMVYACNTFLDIFVLANLEEMMKGFHEDIHINLVILMDRESVAQLEPFEEYFNDTRLYVMRHDGKTGRLDRINGTPQLPEITTISEDYEANMGDPATLARFIEYVKKNYPAQHFGLIFHSHGFGVGGFSEDMTNDYDVLHVGEINDPDNPDSLTKAHAVDMLIFNCCSMGGIETAYQFRKSADNPGFYADYMLAAPTELFSMQFKYDTIFKRISTTGGTIPGDKEDITGGTADERIYDPRTMTPVELGRIIIEEERDSLFAENPGWARYTVISLYDLSNARPVKAAMDELAISLYVHNEKNKLEALRDDGTKVYPHFNYCHTVNEWEWEVLEFPFYELYDVCHGIENGDFSENTKAKAALVKHAMKNLLLYSYYNEEIGNLKGISLFMPHGDYVLKTTGLLAGDRMFRHQWWYNALYVGDVYPTKLITQRYYGKLSWCADGATPGDGIVSNYFELLDAWYDGGDLQQGGWNRYRY
ncbi:MAG: hypothetical protein JXA20_01095 [Spirochaetes bacterium]|nr:hypothetical protein [Spirochaetota bacterium]